MSSLRGTEHQPTGVRTLQGQPGSLGMPTQRVIESGSKSASADRLRRAAAPTGGPNDHTVGLSPAHGAGRSGSYGTEAEAESGRAGQHEG